MATKAKRAFQSNRRSYALSVQTKLTIQQSMPTFRLWRSPVAPVDRSLLGPLNLASGSNVLANGRTTITLAENGADVNAMYKGPMSE